MSFEPVYIAITTMIYEVLTFEPTDALLTDTAATLAPIIKFFTDTDGFLGYAYLSSRSLIWLFKLVFLLDYTSGLVKKRIILHLLWSVSA